MKTSACGTPPPSRPSDGSWMPEFGSSSTKTWWLTRWVCSKPCWPDVVGHGFDPSWLPDGDGSEYASGSLRGGDVRIDRVDSWRSRLTEREVALVLRGCGAKMSEFGYPMDGGQAPGWPPSHAQHQGGPPSGGAGPRGPRQLARRLSYRAHSPGPQTHGSGNGAT